jgi:U3 small nucleolar RNA-associated protein 25
VKLYADFFQSDIIVASPIALATKLAEAEKGSPEDMDFLSSVEIVVASRCDVCQMQNWSHVVSGQSLVTPAPWLT